MTTSSPLRHRRGAIAGSGWQRFAVPALLALGWGIAIAAMWGALTTLPSAERLGHSRTVAIPTLRGFALQAAVSAGELVVLLALTWPGRAALLRLWLAALGAWGWFFVTAPIAINTMQWAHRRWLAAAALALLLLAVAASARAILRAYRAPA